jgi:RND family efflux transporter MFP subunit
MVGHRGRQHLCLTSALAGITLFAIGRDALCQSPLSGEAGRLGMPTTQPAYPTVTGITTPRQIVKLASVQLERISRIAVTEGQIVPEGEPVIVFDDAVQRARTEMTRAAAESTLEVDLAQRRMEQAQREHERVSGLASTQAVSPKELNDAAVEAAITRLEYEIMRFRSAQARREYERERLVLERLTLRAPFAGYIAEIVKRAGESVKEGEPIATIVQLNPVEVTVDCPLAFAARVREGDQAGVKPVDAQWPPRTGTVTFASRAADAASQTFKVKLIVPNDDLAWITGLKVSVEFRPSEAPGSARGGSQSSGVAAGPRPFRRPDPHHGRP